MTMKKLYYITRARIPSEKAHSFQIMKMCETFVRCGYEVTLMVPARENNIQENPFQYFSIPAVFSIVYVPVPPLIRRGFGARLLFWIEGLCFLLRQSRQAQPEKEAVIFTRSIEVALWYRCLGYKKVIVELHDWPGSFTWLFGWLLRLIPKVVVTAEGLAEECVRVGRSVLVAPNGVDEMFFEPHTPLLRSEVGIPIERSVVMYVGALALWKGVGTLLEASRILPPSFVVVIAGGAREEVERLRREYPHVLFLGQTPVHELHRYQRLADILVVPNSPEEALSARYTSPIKLFAHLASKKPIIVSDLPSMRSIVSNKEVVFFDGSCTDLVQKIIAISSTAPTDIQILTDRAYELAKRSTWKNRAEKILTLFA